MAAEQSAHGGVQSVDRVLDLLELMADADGETSLSQLAAASGLPLPTIHRLVATLVRRGYVRRLPSRRYALGPRLVPLGETAGRALGASARPHLAGLVEALGETANLAMLDGEMVVYVAQVPSHHSMRMFTEVGRRVHMHSTGVGKAVLAQLTDEAVHTVVERAGLPRQTPRTITDLEDLSGELDAIREQGYAVDDGEQEVGVRCYAVPVPGAPTPAALSISGPDTRVDADAGGRVVPVLRDAAAALAASIGP
ncbi:IclR family transcriptional regulator [Haloactinopolyspora alba]|uniref:Glycerol operon regulatory protein n=1 Tax=Haloactinopolyspora alba TaxID=648780 RepID=A0A2P8DZY0_9ACTN|nr:IclR family transcriptional regulator [Haloactinopolyspora alba]PSL02770.1 IclR family transcriptional regulator [Haloactinopolyspora alba]